MSVVVRMEMPKSCEKCPACDYEEGNCLLADDRNTLPHNGKRRSWCPIICALPEGHGRLGDLYALRENALKWLPSDPCGDQENEYRAETDICVSMIQDIDDAPTIVPAERREEE